VELTRHVLIIDTLTE